jgi:hypothetical protein
MEEFDLELSWSRDKEEESRPQFQRWRQRRRLDKEEIAAPSVQVTFDKEKGPKEPAESKESLLGWLEQLGVRDEADNYYKHTHLQNRIGWMFFVQNFIMLGIFTYFELYYSVFTVTVIQLFHIAAFVANARQKRVLSRLFFVYNFFGAAIMTAWNLGLDCGARLFIFPSIVVWIFLTPTNGHLGRSSILRISVPLLSSMGVWVVMTRTADMTLFREKVDPDLLKFVNEKILFYICLVVSIVTVVSVVWWMK